MKIKGVKNKIMIRLLTEVFYYYSDIPDILINWTVWLHHLKKCGMFYLCRDEESKIDIS